MFWDRRCTTLTNENKIVPKEDLLVCEWNLYLLNFHVFDTIESTRRLAAFELGRPGHAHIGNGKNE